jgi:hypothetical protein
MVGITWASVYIYVIQYSLASSYSSSAFGYILLCIRTLTKTKVCLRKFRLATYPNTNKEGGVTKAIAFYA